MTESYTKVLRFVTIACCKCGIHFGIPSYFDEKRREDCGLFSCPNGHGQAYTESTTKRLEKRIEVLQVSLNSAREDATTQRQLKRKEERRVKAYRGVVTKLKTRAKNGVCPCCTRHFLDLESPIKTKHPKFGVKKPNA